MGYINNFEIIKVENDPFGRLFRLIAFLCLLVYKNLIFVSIRRTCKRWK